MSRELTLEERQDMDTARRLAKQEKLAGMELMTETEYAKALAAVAPKKIRKLSFVNGKNPVLEEGKRLRRKRIMELLAEHGDMSRIQIAEHLNCGVSSVAEHVWPLIRDGKVERKNWNTARSCYSLIGEQNRLTYDGAGQ